MICLNTPWPILRPDRLQFSVKQNIATRNNIVRKLTRSSWDVHTLRVPAMALCFSAAVEYAAKL